MDAKNQSSSRGTTAVGRKGDSSVMRRSGASRAAAPILARSGLTPAERHELIARSAYLKAERRGFQGGSPEQDWLEAEAEFNAIFMRVRGRND